MHERFVPAFSAQSGYFDHFLGNAYFLTPFESLSAFRAPFYRRRTTRRPPLSTQTKAGAQSAPDLFGRLLGRPICPVNTPIAIP